MAAQKAKACILQIIDQLRQRKARPDIVRICHMAERKHGMKRPETEAQLEKLVEAGVVVKVDYKGSVSYRNAEKWKKTQFGHKAMKSAKTSECILDAVKAIIKLTDTSDEKERKGASIKEIEKWLAVSSDEMRFEKGQLKLHIEKELERGELEKLPNGNYTLHKQKLSAAVEDNGDERRRGRPPSKRKRFKKTHGPDFETPVITKRPVSADDDLSCDYCLKTKSYRKGEPEGILVCKDCNAKAHPSCMGYSLTLAKRALDSPWQCIDCKTCYVCEDSGDADMMLFCDACDKGYHMNCHEPPVEDKPQGKWVCSICENDGSDSQEEEEYDETFEESNLHDESGPSCLPTPCDSPITSDEEAVVPSKFKKKNSERKKSVSLSKSENKEMVYPDVSRWSMDEVSKFFSDLGFKEQADSLREQEIDGQSLLLLKRSDVLTGLSIRLGPALKMYQHVMKLQLVGVRSLQTSTR
ncbi:hypothetical protein FSP39_000011 [Pinctada imbricata]|uniref:Uncharacterized protein n=1 Tax=Pinctada imbricata TaxID=66713 RepID=A0AA88XN20_PINIB|nr:hypothetical protein FSP39_000011 [Pinctada imbricata]